MDSEKELIKNAQDGDEKAINLLMKTYSSLVTVISRKYFLINSSVEDLIQEGMVGLFNAYRTYNLASPVSFKSYAEICISRQILTALKANNRNKNIPLNTYFSINNQGKILLSVKQDENLEEEEENGFYVSSSNLTPEESVLFKEKLLELNDKVNQLLSRFEKQVLSLYIKGLNYVEIAEKLKKQPKSIDNALNRIKIKLRKIII